jgi:hypothetical protein
VGFAPTSLDRPDIQLPIADCRLPIVSTIEDWGLGMGLAIADWIGD